MRTALGGLRARLLVGCMTPLIAAAACQAIYAVSAQRGAMLGGLQEKARSLCKLMVDVVGPSLAVGDPDGVRQGLAYVRQDLDFTFAAVLGSEGNGGKAKVVSFVGPEADRAFLVAPLTLVEAPRFLATGDLVTALYPLRPGSTALGTVAIGLRTANVRAAVSRMVLRALAIATAGILVALVVVLLMASAILRRNRDLKLIMDNVGQGFLSVRRNGDVLPEHSTILESWFGPWRPGVPLWSYLATTAPDLAGWFEVFWDNVSAEVLPIEMALEQLPTRGSIGARTFEFSYRPIGRGTHLTHILVVVSDVTLAVERERATVAQRELVSLFQWLLKDKQGLLEFFEDGRRLCGDVCAEANEDRVLLKRRLHTLKGNCAVFNLATVASVCQDLETRMQDGAGELGREERARLASTWREAESRLQLLRGEAKSESTCIEIEPHEHEQVLAAIGEETPHPKLFEMVCLWTWEPTRRRLERVAQQASALGRQLAKGDIVVRVEGGGLRVPSDRLAGFWSNLIHVVRNAVDHGLETPSRRQEIGKSAVGTLTLRSLLRAERLVVEIEDDGAGVSWDKVRARALSLGLPAEGHADLVEALFADGLSTRSEVTEISGRGVGMSAVRAACVDSGGTVEVWSAAGEGTRFEFSWPMAILAVRPAAGARGFGTAGVTANGRVAAVVAAERSAPH